MTAVPNLSVRQLIAVSTVAKYASFIAAASEMRLSQPGLSRIIRTVEEELGVNLFDRTTRQVTLTSAGAEFVPIAERVLHDLDLGTAALRGLSKYSRGHIAVACPMSLATLVLSRIVVGFKKVHPHITIQVLESIQSETIEAVRTGRADFGIAYTDTDREFITEALFDTNYHVIFHKNHEFSKRSSITIPDLKDEPLISLPATSNLRRLFDGASAHHGFRLNHAITVNTFSTLLEFVENGAGVTIVPAPWLPSNRSIQSCPIIAPDIKATLSIIRLKSRPLSTAARHLEDLIRDYLLSEHKRLDVQNR